MKAADTSALVSAFASWHEKHEAALAALAGEVRLIEFGGAAHDALVVATAAYVGAVLASCDGPAAPIYERYGVQTRVL